jgi:hypothetical protein
MISIKFLSLFSFVSFLILDYLIKNNYLGQSIKKNYFKFIGLNYFYIVFILTGIVFLILMLFSYFGIYLFCVDNSVFDGDLFKCMSDTWVNNNTVKADGTVNINHPNFSVSVPTSSLNNLAAAASVAGGGTLALKVAQQVPGGPGVKIAAAGATRLGSQALTLGVAKILNDQNSTNNTKNLINLFDGLSNNTKLNIISNLNDNRVSLNEFPLNLLPEINQLATAELMFLFIILNIFIVKYFTSLDYNKYIPNNKVGNILKLIINRYILLWSKSVKVLLIVS